MPPVAAIGAGIGALGSVVGGVIQGNAANSAADKQAAASQQATALQKQMYDQQRQDNSPYREAGTGALSQMQDPSFQHSFGMSDYQADPGYAFRLQQGQQALERSAAARGGLQSGGTLKGLTDYAQGMASQEYGNAYNRFTNDQTNRFNRLSNIAGMGLQANGMTGQAGQSYANQAGENMMGAANAQGAAGMAAGKQWGTTLSGLGSGLGQNIMDIDAQNKQQNWLDSVMPKPVQPPAYSGGFGGTPGPITFGASLPPMNFPKPF